MYNYIKQYLYNTIICNKASNGGDDLGWAKHAATLRYT